MKKIILFNAFLLLSVFSVNAQFQQSFTNPPGYSCDHYSIETFSDGGMATYAAAGTFFNNTSGVTYMHIFTMDGTGTIVWENYVNLGTTDARILDIAIGPDYSVAVTGFVDYGGGPQLYAAWYNAAGILINDFQFTGSTNSTGNNIFYSRTNSQFIIGGFESVGSTLSGNALLIALDGSFSYQWSTIYDSQCDGFGMAVINEILEINEHYFITGNLSAPIGTPTYGQSQVLVAMVDNGSGTILTNASFAATNTLGGQEAMGVSAHYDRETETLVLMYNVSVSPTVDENRPYLNIYNVSGVDLNLLNSYRIEDTFISNPSGFTNNPNFTGLKLIRNATNDTYLIFGMVEAYGGASDEVISVYQEIDLNSGTLVALARTWTPSNIVTGYPAHGGFYSLFDPTTLSTKVYTPETTTLGTEGQNFVSILPTPGTSISYDVISSTLNTVAASSACIEEFEMELVEHDIYVDMCLSEDMISGTISAPLFGETMFASNQTQPCPIAMGPAVGTTEFETSTSEINELRLYANPATDVLNYSLSEKGTYNMIIMSVEGQILVSEQIDNTTDQNQINIQHLASGIYVLVAVDENGQAIQKRFAKN